MRRLLLVCVLAGCPSEPPPECTTVDTMCAPGYVPTFDNVYNNTMRTGCGSTMSSCHSASGAAGGLSLADKQTAYDQLMQDNRVKPGDAACSEMIVRVHGIDKDYQMPPGDPLSEPARCALVQWVQQGAMP
jgi:hypothetical protein